MVLISGVSAGQATLRVMPTNEYDKWYFTLSLDGVSTKSFWISPSLQKEGEFLFHSNEDNANAIGFKLGSQFLVQYKDQNDLSVVLSIMMLKEHIEIRQHKSAPGGSWYDNRTNEQFQDWSLRTSWSTILYPPKNINSGR